MTTTQLSTAAGIAAASLCLALTARASGVNGLDPDVPTLTIDLATTAPATHAMTRVHGPDRDQGDAGVPVAGGYDCDGDGRKDYAVGHFLMDPLGRQGAGQVALVFGDTSVNDTFDLALSNPRVLRIYGSGNQGEREACGNEIWMGDVTGDGIGDLIVCRQNYSLPGRIGAGAVSIVVGSPALRARAQAGQVVDFANPPAGITIVTLVGRHSNARLGIWARTGDVDGDGVADLLVAADQETAPGTHNGAAYVLRGGAHLNTSVTFDLANFGTGPLAGNLARVTPPSGSDHYHLGSTNYVGDLDGNGRSELLLSAALNRSGAAVGPSSGTTHATGGAPNGWAFIVWDDNFPTAPWAPNLTVNMQSPAGSLTTIRSGAGSDTFGEELLGGLDYDGDGNADLFVGDLTGDGTVGSRPFSGVGYVFYNAQNLRGRNFSIDDVVALNLPTTKILGPSVGAIGADTVADGDLDGDGYDDLVFGSPTDSPLGRSDAGSMQIFFGKPGGWPATIDCAPGQFPSQAVMRITEVIGREGNGSFGDTGDTLCYSAAAGDIDDDGLFDLLVNEMRGDGVNASSDFDAGNLLVLTGPFLKYATQSIGSAYCAAVSNSTGATGTTKALGSTSIARNELQLEAARLPLNSVGYFITSTTQAFIPQPGGSMGNLCVAGNIGRYAGSVLSSGSMGNFTLWVDLSNMPSPTGNVAVLPGQTWRFQAWHRDTVAGGSTSNFTQGLAITFN